MSNWTTCPICGETDMRQEIDADGNKLIFCVNHNCGSNGGNNFCNVLHERNLQLKPMATAPRSGNEKVLVLDEWYECGQMIQDWRFVYWLDSSENQKPGWFGENCNDLRNPQGWILSTKQLSI